MTVVASVFITFVGRGFSEVLTPPFPQTPLPFPTFLTIGRETTLTQVKGKGWQKVHVDRVVDYNTRDEGSGGDLVATVLKT